MPDSSTPAAAPTGPSSSTVSTVQTSAAPDPDRACRARWLGEAPVVATYTRSGFVESVHHGIVVVTDAGGEVVLQRGAVDLPIFPRSANKPMQAVAMLRCGLDLDGELLALASASHNGEPFHLDGARRILAGAGLTEADLQNTPDRPIHEPERERWLAERRPPSSIAQNCSGKHSAMLATCVAAGWDTATYRDPAHPLQQAMAHTLSDLAAEPVAATGTDGCGAPVMAISTAGLARAFGLLAGAGPGTPEGRVAAAIRSHPEFLGGTDRDVTALVRGIPGLIAKDGAEAVYAVGLADGRGIALKVTDGNQRAAPVVVAAVLRGLDLDDIDRVAVEATLRLLEAAPVLGHGQPVGAVEATGF